VDDFHLVGWVLLVLAVVSGLLALLLRSVKPDPSALPSTIAE
jgi:hypothetical protein